MLRVTGKRVFGMKALLSKVWALFTMLPNALLTFGCSLIEEIPPRDLTVTRIGVTEIRIRSYWETHGQLPARLSDLPILKGRDNSTIDGWGRAIRYDVAGTSIVTLSSFGADGVAGGEGLNQDIIVTFDVNKLSDR